ncbi:hypothetical protein FRACA_1460016 [Frankia canadensis]|uniref:Uncharacterized protein n=1 Tax=Frankia canadensis TaxID=1836972 RepID=A0A2I2KLP8_9ACTN|nr:hypothetical protein FRACA_1460016 [Frankia canadensis]SOU53869.1 hypothetical protein FRACA_1460016 [Frankia canadensis]
MGAESLMALTTVFIFWKLSVIDD